LSRRRYLSVLAKNAHVFNTTMRVYSSLNNSLISTNMALLTLRESPSSTNLHKLSLYSTYVFLSSRKRKRKSRKRRPLKPRTNRSW